MNERPASIAAQIADLGHLPMAELWVLWDRYFERRPDHPNRTHVESRVAYKLQEEVHGGLAPQTRQRLEAIGAKHSKIKLRAKPRTFSFAPGTVLLREWGEREHRVTVNADGHFEYEGHRFKSLTAVARHITGQHWSGPLFFGLKGGA
ncbi:MAG: elements of external origin [Rubrivivax sp. SCN 71-131]|nr:MAG: elements of external origin [Rubrivivax sp. SCN 71-131]